MTQLAYDNLLTTLYLLAWVAMLVWYHWKYRSLDAGSAIIASYILYATLSLLTLNDPLFSISYNPLKLFPYIYLYAMLMVALLPAIYTHRHPVEEIADPGTRVLKIIAFISIVSALFLVPDIINNFSSGVVKLFTDIDAGNDNYQEQSSDNADAGQGIRNLPAVIYNSISDITIFLCFYFLTLKKKPKLLIVGLFFSIFVGLTLPIIRGSRGGVIMALMAIVGAFMLLRQYMQKKVRRTMQIAGLAGIIAFTLPVVAITISRFGNMNGGIFGFLNWYVGQGNLYFNNYALDAGGIRHGDRTIAMFKRVVDPSTPMNYTDQRDKNHNMEINDDVFTTFVGDIALDFGPVATVLIFIVFYGWVIAKIRPRDGTIRLHQCLLTYFTVCICMEGGMALFPYSYTGNIRIVAFALLYAYLRYHEVLQERFPILSTTDPTEENHEESH